MIRPVLLALALFALQAAQPPPAPAQTFAECQAYLCLPAGFSTHGGSPTTACDAAHEAVLRRLARGMDPLPSWSSCAARFGWDAANLGWTFPTQVSCPNGGARAGNTCRYTDLQGCTYSGAARIHGHVGVVIDGASHGYQLPYTVQEADTLALDPGQDPLVCRQPPPPPPNNNGRCCAPQAVNYYWTGPATAPSKTLVCTPTPVNAGRPGDPPPQRGGEPYNPPNCCPPWALHHQWAYDRNSLACVLGGILP